MRVDEIDVSNVVFVENKIKLTMCRLNAVQKWHPKFRFYIAKSRMIIKLMKQLDFLKQVQKVKYKML